jgi:uncharacterized membrane protein YeaQ/YmgE (transglycosylase-associated protein family)
MGLLAFIAAGFVVGLVARAVTTGKAGMTLAPSALFGLTGSFLGALVGCLIHRGHAFDGIGTGVIGAVAGVFFVLFLFGVRARGRRRATF